MKSNILNKISGLFSKKSRRKVKISPAKKSEALIKPKTKAKEKLPLAPHHILGVEKETINSLAGKYSATTLCKALTSTRNDAQSKKIYQAAKKCAHYQLETNSNLYKKCNKAYLNGNLNKSLNLIKIKFETTKNAEEKTNLEADFFLKSIILDYFETKQKNILDGLEVRTAALKPHKDARITDLQKRLADLYRDNILF